MILGIVIGIAVGGGLCCYALYRAFKKMNW